MKNSDVQRLSAVVVRHRDRRVVLVSSCAGSLKLKVERMEGTDEVGGEKWGVDEDADSALVEALVSRCVGSVPRWAWDRASPARWPSWLPQNRESSPEVVA